LSLAPREHLLLKLLLQKSGEPISRQQILDRIFKDDEDVQSSVIDVLMHRLRKRLEGTSVRIQTYRGIGYVLELDE
jgi:two-component system response regulator TctD